MVTPREQIKAGIIDAGKLLIEEAEHICSSKSDAAEAAVDIRIHVDTDGMPIVEVMNTYHPYKETARLLRKE